jgi:hypothetical protein
MPALLDNVWIEGQTPKCTLLGSGGGFLVHLKCINQLVVFGLVFHKGAKNGE